LSGFSVISGNLVSKITITIPPLEQFVSVRLRKCRRLLLSRCSSLHYGSSPMRLPLHIRWGEESALEMDTVSHDVKFFFGLLLKKKSDVPA
jgi:hypothetical protein